MTKAKKVWFQNPKKSKSDPDRRNQLSECKESKIKVGVGHAVNVIKIPISVEVEVKFRNNAVGKYFII